jgi:hydrogenase assembly chaperone HypC/HupF
MDPRSWWRAPEMCISAPGLVTAVDEGVAHVRVDGMTRTALTLLTPGVRPGDWVLVGAGAVIRRIPRDEARSIRRVIGAVRPPDPASQPGDPS